jgi:cation diffusion facilitator CzcD-associated flavoprotein CzcO
MSNHFPGCHFTVIGAGPYGLAVASHLRAQGAAVRIFGKTMDFWHSQMPKGMLLRSPWAGSSIGDPARACTLDRYEAARGAKLARQLPVKDFVGYGLWFQQQNLPDLDGRSVSWIECEGDGYRVALDDGETFSTRNVVVATGIGAFANCPAPYAALPLELASHTSHRLNRDLGRFRGRRVAVVGAGQSAVESAALLREAGAEVELLVRHPFLRWLKSGSLLQWVNRRINPLKAPGKVGPMVVDWLIEKPHLFTLTPRAFQNWATYRAIRPAASAWLRPRMQGIPIAAGCHAVAAVEKGGKVHLHLHDGGERTFDHVLLGTGYKIDIARYGFLSTKMLDAVRTVNGYPVLNAGFESSLPGLFFVGATAAHSFGPLCRFVQGTQYTAAALARSARRRPVPQVLATARV